MTYKQTFWRTFAAMAALLLTMPAMFGADYAKFHEYAGEVGSISVNDENVFPDAQFRIFLDYVDADKNGSLSLEEAKAYSQKGTMNCIGRGIASLAGIEIFEELQVLDCSNNQLTELDLTFNTHLTRVDCFLNQLSDENMDALIASLPIAEDAMLVAVDRKNVLENNSVTVAQVNAAAQRGWTVYNYNRGQELVAYEGYDPDEKYWSFTGGDGSGSIDDPFIISNVYDLEYLFKSVRFGSNYEGAYFIVTNDINCNGAATIFTVSDKVFSGNLDGCGHTISNFIIESNGSLAGLFGKTENATIKNLILDGYIEASSGAAGAFVGVATSTVIENCESRCIIFGASTGGGIVGRLESGNVVDCRSSGRIDGHNGGGIVGQLLSGKVINCRSFAEVYSYFAGGIVGQGFGGEINNCVFAGALTLQANSGGIVGKNQGTRITNNLSIGDVGDSGSGIVGSQTARHYLLSNNFYTQAGNYGVDGKDIAGRAMRGYTINGDDKVKVELPENASTGVAYNEVVYAGAGQQVVLRLSCKQNEAQSAPALRVQAQTAFKASGGSLIDNGDGTWTLTMPAEDVVITIRLNGDVNCDGQVNIVDVTTLIDALLSNTASTLPNGDCDSDGEVNINDLTTLIDTLLNSN